MSLIQQITTTRRRIVVTIALLLTAFMVVKSRTSVHEKQHTIEMQQALSQHHHAAEIPTAHPLATNSWEGPLRVMFVGDSVTEGVATSHAQALRKTQVPKEGSCSYRFPLMKLLEKKNPGLSLLPVGPFVGHVGTRDTNEECRQQLTNYTKGTSNRHASVWGITASELIGPSDLQKKRLYARKYYFGRKSPQALSIDRDVTIDMLHAQRETLPRTSDEDTSSFGVALLEREHLRRWAYFLKPQLVVVHIGTNDLSTGATAETLVLDRWPKSILALLIPEVTVTSSEPSPKSKHEIQCPSPQHRSIALTSLLPRSSPSHQSLIDQSNRWLSQIDVCKHHASTAAEGTNSCAACVASNVPSNLPPRGPSQMSLETVAHAWCLPCVFLLNISDPRRINDSLAYMYDGLHPNAAGEERIGELLADALEGSGGLTYLAN
ncbi:membrane-associated protein, putative [Bodo saltans]|uniref:Membrane-associated protein, putative n=1 Tax=Bodo saltans TaxID=75058 RepID=A0A0S4JAN7_BODSA|nr:membrane-associated protein, putative [Bodo saltans]|eukprot:CUG88534.1 membrane-associated protein, putative [Bodo saltans]